MVTTWGLSDDDLLKDWQGSLEKQQCLPQLQHTKKNCINYHFGRRVLTAPRGHNLLIPETQKAMVF